MVKRKTAQQIRKAHRYLGLFLGVQFLMWTLSGMYFSWTDLDEIHGDHFRRTEPLKSSFSDLPGIGALKVPKPVTSLELIEIADKPYYWINHSLLVDARSGGLREGITEEEALSVARRHMLPQLQVAGIRRIDSVGPHHEYRGRPLPAYEIQYDRPERLTAYVAVSNGAFQTVRHRSWRWFDFLWMTHTMDYQGRDNFNTVVLRGFSLMGLITVLSGFALWGVSSPRLRKLRRRIKGSKRAAASRTNA